MFRAQRATIHKAKLPVYTVFTRPWVVFVLLQNLAKRRPILYHADTRWRHAPIGRDFLKFRSDAYHGVRSLQQSLLQPLVVSGNQAR